MNGPVDRGGLNLAKALYPALAGGDRTTLDQLLHPEFVGETTPGLPLGLGGRYDGPRAMRREFWAVIGREFDLTAQPADFALLADNRVMVRGSYVGAARSTGAPLDAWFVHTLVFRDGRISGLTQLTDSQRWVAALTKDPANGRTRCASDEDIGRDMSTLTTVSYRVQNAVARIQLERPDAANAINAEMAADLCTVATAVATDPAIRVVLLTGAGDRFCAGGDIALFAATPPEDLPGLLNAMITDYHVALRTLCGLRVPIVCAVQGSAAGGGLGLLHASDIIIAADDAKFTLGYSGLGLTFDGANSWFLPRLLGPARTALMYLENAIIVADDALAAGLVSELVPSPDLLGRANALVEKLAAGPTVALGTARQLLRRAWTSSLDEHLDLERQTIAEVAATVDAAEGIDAFIGKRAPSFSGA